MESPRCSNIFDIDRSVVLGHYRYQHGLFTYNITKEDQRAVIFCGFKVSEVWNFIADYQHGLVTVLRRSEACMRGLTCSKVAERVHEEQSEHPPTMTGGTHQKFDCRWSTNPAAD
jgi:hypothetical protein